MIFETLAPAKVNLVLRVGPRRANGYHDIRSLMVPLDLADRVRVKLSSRPGQITCRCPGRPDLDGPGNLAARAAALFRQRYGTSGACEIRIGKRIPVTAGLGGGSSDAAAVLRCLARAHRIRDGRALAELALEVGSDVPFFLGPGPSWVGGRGERLVSTTVPRLDLVLVYPRDPRLAIRAADAYGWLDEDRARGRPARNLGRPGPFRPSGVANDLEAPCLKRHPEVERLLRRLVGEGATNAIMSGSGPTVFGLFSDRRAAHRAAGAMAAQLAGDAALDVFVARSLQRRPGVSPWKSPRSESSR